MRPTLIAIFTATWVFGHGGASAQNGDLAGVTMRVLDDVSDIRAVILALDANRGEDEEGAERGRAPSEEADAAEPNAAETAADDGGLDRETLHSTDHDELSEGKLEDNDVEVPAAAPTP